MEKHKIYESPRIKVLQMEEVMGLPSSIPDPGFGGKETEFEEETDTWTPAIERTNLWEE